MDWENFSNEHSELNTLRTQIHGVMGWSVQCLSLTEKYKFDEVIQKKTMVVEELNRQATISKGESYERRIGKLSVNGAEAP
jgi:hypothetical protein